MGDIAELPQAQIGEEIATSLGLVRPEVISRSSEPDLSSCRLIWESAATSRCYKKREVVFGGAYTSERSRQAFEDYKLIRNEVDRARRRAEFEREITICKLSGRSKDVKHVEQAFRENEHGYNPQGGEVVLQCIDFPEARDRVLELIGPVEPGARRFRYSRMGEDSKFRQDGIKGPVNGFEATVAFENHGTLQQFSRSWRVDYDPRKGPHFNVAIRPVAILGDVVHYLSNKDPESLSVAIVYPGDVQSYRRSLHQVEISAITSLDNNGDSTNLDYL